MTERRATEDDLRRLAGADWWEWKVGMRVGNVDGRRWLIVRVDSGLVQTVSRDLSRNRWSSAGDLVPVPSDPATVGFMLEAYLRRGGSFLGLEGLAAARPGPEAYASAGDFLAAQLLGGER